MTDNSVSSRGTNNVYRSSSAQPLDPTHLFQGNPSGLLAIFEYAGNGLVVMDLEGNILMCNPLFSLLFGYNSNELCGLRLETLSDLQDFALVQGGFRQFISIGADHYHQEARFICKDGNRIWGRITMTCVRDAQEKPQYVIGMFENITQRKRAEMALAESEAYYRSLFDYSPIPLVEEDFSDTKAYLEGLSASGIEDLRSYLRENAEPLREAVARIRILNANQAMITARGYQDRLDYLEHGVGQFPDNLDTMVDELFAIFEGRTEFQQIKMNQRIQGRRYDYDLHWVIVPGHEKTLSKAIVSIQDITEQVRSQVALRRSQMRLADAQKMAHLGDFLYDPVEEKTECSEETYRIFGWNPYDPPPGPQEFLTLIVPEDRERVVQAFAQAVEKAQPFQIESRVRLSNGALKYLHGIGQPVTDASGQVVQVFGAVLDITDQKTIEIALQESEKRYRRLFDYSPISLWEQDYSGVKMYLNALRKQGVDDFHNYLSEHPEQVINALSRVRILDVNQATLDLYQVPSKELFLSQIKDQFLERPDLFVNELAAIAEGNNSFHQVSKNIPLSGEPFEIDMQWMALPEAEKDLSRVIFAMQNISERVRAVDALAKSEKKFRSLVEQSEDGMVLTDEAGIVVEWNRGAERIYGVSKPEAQGRPLWELYQRLVVSDNGGPKKADAFKAAVLQSCQGGQSPYLNHFIEYEIEKKDGSRLVIQSIMFPIQAEQGYMTCTTTRDITDRKQSEMLLGKSLEQLHALSAHLQSVREDERTNISREIHDELGQSLTALKMDLFWVRNKIEKSGNGPVYKTVSDKINAMVLLVDEIIDSVRRISTELRPSILDTLGLVPAIEWMVHDFETRNHSVCRFRTALHGIHLDPEMATAVFRICQETLTNVTRHARATRVEVSLNQMDDQLVLDVHDNGKGITEQELLDPKSLGILGMKERAHRFGGDIQITGSPVAGTRVVVSLPLGGLNPAGGEHP